MGKELDRYPELLDRRCHETGQGSRTGIILDDAYLLSLHCAPSLRARTRAENLKQTKALFLQGLHKQQQ